MYAFLAPAQRQPAALPGRIEAEDYDTGGEGVAYHDTTPGNEGGVYRLDDVDIEPLIGSKGYNVGWIRPGEWLEYRVKVSAGGAYTLRVRGASRWGAPSLSLLVDGVAGRDRADLHQRVLRRLRSHERDREPARGGAPAPARALGVLSTWTISSSRP